MSLARLHPVSQFGPGPGVVEGAVSHDKWHISPEHSLMPPDRLRLQGCVQHLFVCICIYVPRLCHKDVTVIKIMGIKMNIS